MPRRRIAAAALALSIALLLVLQTSGVATAFEYESRVHCCCGTHEASDPCGCPDCPDSGHVALAKNERREIPRLPLVRSCRSRFVAVAVPWVPAMPAGGAAALGAAPPIVGRIDPLPVLPLVSHLLVAARPPP